MPGGKPVWHGNLSGVYLESLFGFIQAFVVCPNSLERPFLTYRKRSEPTLIFPIGDCVYYTETEEFKYAQKLGYTLLLIKGYLFEKIEIPFNSYVS